MHYQKKEKEKKTPHVYSLYFLEVYVLTVIVENKFAVRVCSLLFSLIFLGNSSKEFANSLVNKREEKKRNYSITTIVVLL